MKNALPYYKRYPRDFMEGTAGMTFEEKGAYSILLDMIYMQNGQLPDDERWISGWLGCSVRTWKKLRAAFIERGKIEVNGKFLENNRANIELKSLENFREKQSVNAASRSKNNGIAEDLAPAKKSQPEPEPDKSKKEPSAPKKGTRIPDDFRPDLEWSQAQGLTNKELKFEFEQFTDYWQTATGQIASKLDWQKTWKVWIRNVLKRRGSKPKGETVGQYAYRTMMENKTNGAGNHGTAGLFDEGDTGPNQAGLSLLIDLANSKD